MSVDTYLGAGKSTKGYLVMRERDVRVLVAGVLSTSAARAKITLKRFLIWKSIAVELEPIGDHFHSPT